jgi:hypothetical protein
METGYIAAGVAFWLAVAAFGFGYLVGQQRGWSALWSALRREGYRVILCKDRPPGEGRLTVIEEAPPF